MNPPRKIRVWIARQGMTQRELADQAGIGYRQLTRALQTGRATPAVREAIRDLTGVELEAASRVPWGAKETKELVLNHGMAPMAEIAEALGRSVASCANRLRRLRRRG